LSLPSARTSYVPFRRASCWRRWREARAYAGSGSCGRTRRKRWRRLRAFPGGRRLRAKSLSSLDSHVGNERGNSCAFERRAQLALVPGAGPGDAARHNAPAFGHVTLEQSNVLKVDVIDLFVAETAYAFAAEEIAASAHSFLLLPLLPVPAISIFVSISVSWCWHVYFSLGFGSRVS